MGRRIHVFLGKLLAEVDEARGDLSRSAYIRRALEAQVELDKRVREVLREAVTGAVGRVPYREDLEEEP